MLAALLLLLLLLTTLTAAAATNSRLTQLLSLVSLSLPPLPLLLYLHLILFLLSSFPSPLPLSLLLSSPSLSFGINLSLPPSLFPLVAPDHSFRSTITPPCLNHLAYLSFSLCQISLCLVCPFWNYHVQENRISNSLVGETIIVFSFPFFFRIKRQLNKPFYYNSGLSCPPFSATEETPFSSVPSKSHFGQKKAHPIVGKFANKVEPKKLFCLYLSRNSTQKKNCRRESKKRSLLLT